MDIISQMYVHLLTHPERGKDIHRYDKMQNCFLSTKRSYTEAVKNLFKHLHEMIFTKKQQNGSRFSFNYDNTFIPTCNTLYLNTNNNIVTYS